MRLAKELVFPSPAPSLRISVWGRLFQRNSILVELPLKWGKPQLNWVKMPQFLCYETQGVWGTVFGLNLQATLILVLKLVTKFVSSRVGLTFVRKISTLNVFMLSGHKYCNCLHRWWHFDEIIAKKRDLSLNGQLSSLFMFSISSVSHPIYNKLALVF